MIYRLQGVYIITQSLLQLVLQLGLQINHNNNQLIPYALFKAANGDNLLVTHLHVTCIKKRVIGLWCMTSLSTIFQLYRVNKKTLHDFLVVYCIEYNKYI